MPSSADAPDSRLGFAFALAALAGAVDAIAVLSLGDVFVSFMSGNTTLLGNAVAHGQGGAALQLAAVVVAFLGGVVAGELVAVRVAAHRRSQAVLLLVASGLALASLGTWLALPHLAIALCLAGCMGVQNAAVRRAGGMDVALTYVTGTLVRLGRTIAAAVLGRGAWEAASPVAGLWLSFAVGAAAGGLGASGDPTIAIAAAAAVAVLLAGYATVRSPFAGVAGRTSP